MRLLLLLCGLLLALPAEAAMKAGPNMAGSGHHRLKTPSTSAPLDDFTTPTATCSFRKLKSTYTGNAVKLRRATGGTQDIGFLGATGFTGAPWDEAAAASFCTATTCFVDTCYDHSGAGRDWVQATTANQPQLIFGCNGALPCMRMTATTHFLLAPSMTPATGVVSLNVVANRSAGVGGCPFLREGAVGSNTIRGASANIWQLFITTAINGAATDNVWHSTTGVINGASSVFRIDGTETTGTLTGGVAAGQPTIGGINSTTCDVSEAILWDNYPMVAGERLGLQINQKSYFGTP